MIRAFFVSVAVVLALVAAGMTWGWDIGVCDDPNWRQHREGWLALSAAAFAASWHPAVAWFDRTFSSPRRNP